jgi:hypothetical protein
MSGFYGDLSSQQEEALAKFKDALSDVWKEGYDDHMCLRWLRARNFDVAKSEEMFRNHLEFRKKWGADTILEDYTPPEVLKKYYPHGVFGFDREGHPISYQLTGNSDFRGLVRSVKPEDFTRHIIYLNEKGIKVAEEASRKTGRVIETHTIIMDLENLSYQRHYYWPAIKGFQQSVKLLEDNYPERVKQSLLIKAPKVFPIAYNLIKPFLEERTRKKVKVMGSNWKEELQKYIDPDNLPEMYGGNRREPDAECSDYICIGGDIPNEYYLSNMTDVSTDSMDLVQVGRGSTVQLEYHIEVVGSAIRWEFITTDYDIGFGIFYKDTDTKKRVHKGSMRELIASERKTSHLIPQNGILVCETEGIYVLRFDNTYSWARTKEVKYSVTVLPPDTELVDHTQFMGINRRKEGVSAGGQAESKDSNEGENEEEENDDDFQDAEEEVVPSEDVKLNPESSTNEPAVPKEGSSGEVPSMENGLAKTQPLTEQSETTSD